MDTLIKQPGETIKFAMDMTGIGGIGYGDTVTSVTSVVADSLDLTITDIITDSGTMVYFTIAGGVHNTSYKITVTIVSLINSDILEGDGILRVVDI